MSKHSGDSHKYAPLQNPIGSRIEASGFRNFFKTPRPSQRFHLHGADPMESEGAAQEVRRLMRKLSLRMDADIKWSDHGDREARSWENPNLPSGYTYLLQLLSHDLVQTSVPVSTLGGWRPQTVNARRTGLALETIYGGGPVACPFAYVPDGDRDRSRTKLRLGRIQRDDRTTDRQCPFRDIPRASAESQTTARAAASGRLSWPDPLIADPRNDDHAILSQMATLFAFLHNGLVDLVSRRDQGLPGGDVRDSHHRFLTARAVTSLIYRQVVRNDLMRRLLHPAIYRLYSGDAPRFLDGEQVGDSAAPSQGWSIPLEFSHGVFRFGHSMVRDEYRINEFASNDLVENLQKTSFTDPANMPLNESWVVQWSRFFSINDSKPNLSRRIGPSFSSGLNSEQIFPSIDQSDRVGLAYRDLMSGSLAGLWALQPLIEEIRMRRPELVRASALLDDRELRERQIAQWLREGRAFGSLDDDDIEALAKDPPLPFFFLWEAATEPGVHGLHLGTLGSIIVAEVVFGALARSPFQEERSLEGRRAALRAMFRTFQSDATLEDISNVSTMSDFVLLTANLSCLEDAIPAFV